MRLPLVLRQFLRTECLGIVTLVVSGPSSDAPSALPKCLTTRRSRMRHAASW